jgi:hypothetical protein
LKIGKPFSGRKCRCPSCRTNFVLGNSPKAGEFLAFEVFDEAGDQNGQTRDNSRGFGDKESIPVDFNLQLDILPQKENEKFLSTDISVFEEPATAKSPAPVERPPLINMELPGATRPMQPPAKPPAKPEIRQSPPPPVERKPEPKPVAKSGAHKIPQPTSPPRTPMPASKSLSRPPAPPPPPPVRIGGDSSIEFKPITPEIVRDNAPPLELEPPEEKVVPPPPPIASPPVPKKIDEDYFLPKDYEVTDDWPAAPTQAPPRPVRTTSSSAIQAAPAPPIDEIYEQAVIVNNSSERAPVPPNDEIYEQAVVVNNSSEREPARSRGYDDDRSRRRRGPPREDMRGKWPIVMWGVTLELVAIFVGILGMLVMFLGMLVVGASVSQRSLGGMGGGGIIAVIGALMLGGQGIMRMVAYGLCIASPMRTGARVFAILALVFSLLSAGGYFGSFVLGGHSRENYGQTGGGLFSVIAWFCFLFCLRAIAVALREDGIVEEIKMLMVWLGIFIGCMFVLFLFSCLISGLFVAGAMASKNPDSATGGMAIVGLLSCFFMVVMVIFAFVLFFKYIMILFNVRRAIAYKVS